MINPIYLKDIKDYLSYDPETGIFMWIQKPHKYFRNDFIGLPLVKQHKDGYIRINFRKQHYLAHRLAWWMYHGEFPDNEIDHINGIRDDNRICNLKLATKYENQRNRPCHRKGRIPCIRFREKYTNNPWEARMCIKKKQITIGYFKTQEEAIKAFNKFEENYKKTLTEQTKSSNISKRRI